MPKIQLSHHCPAAYHSPMKMQVKRVYLDKSRVGHGSCTDLQREEGMEGRKGSGVVVLELGEQGRPNLGAGHHGHLRGVPWTAPCLP